MYLLVEISYSCLVDEEESEINMEFKGYNLLNRQTGHKVSMTWFIAALCTRATNFLFWEFFEINLKKFFAEKIYPDSGNFFLEIYSCFQTKCRKATVQKLKFCIKDFFSKCDQMSRKLRFSHIYWINTSWKT